MDEMAKRAAATMAVIALVGVALTINQLRADEPTTHIPPLFTPSATTMQTAKQNPGKTAFYLGCDAGSMPCVDLVNGEWFLFEAAPGKPAKKTPVTMISIGKQDGKTGYFVQK
jgi:hypothetical protein